MSRVTWLHLSDWHQKVFSGSEGVAQDRKTLSESLMQSIKDQMNDEPDLQEIDFVVFSGDVAFKADPAEYEAARVNLFEPLRKAVGFKKFTEKNLFLVPGNHDLNRNLVRIDTKKMDNVDKNIDDVFWSNGIAFRQDVNELFSKPSSKKRLLEPFANFNDFHRKLLSLKTSDKEKDQISYFRKLEKGGTRIGIIGINSAAFCARNYNSKNNNDDFGYLVVSENQISRFTQEAQNVDLCISIMHHPLSWLRESEEYFIFEEVSRNAHFLLHGHEHLPRINVIESTTGDLVVVPAGSVFEKRYNRDPRYTNSYNFVTVDTAKREGTIYFMRWLDRGRGWRRDEDIWEGGAYNFHLPNRQDKIRKRKKAALHEVKKVYGKKADLRFIKSLSVTIKHTLIEKNGVKLVKIYSDRRFVMDKGDPEDFPIKFTHDQLIPELMKKANIQGPAFKVDERKTSPHTLTKLADDTYLIRFPATSNETRIRMDYWLYDLCPGEQFVGLSRFVKSFSIDFEGSNGLKYEVESNGGFPDLNKLDPNFDPSNFTFDSENYEETHWCFPHQGFSIYWQSMT